jgi:phosphate uptake regulator
MSYEYLSEPEKEAIKQSAIRSLEYQKYSLEIEKIAESAKIKPEVERLESLDQQIEEKVVQISAVFAQL